VSRKSYVGKRVTVSFDADVCQHSGKCVNGLAAVFDTAKKPWIDPDGAPSEDVIAQVALCPSGALRIEPTANPSTRQTGDMGYPDSP
jgi:uncharacterized Fe-S cluster protein YjdI